MRAITKWLLLRFSTPTKFEICASLQDTALGVNEIHGPSKAERTAFWIAKNLWIIRHELLVP